MSEGRRGAAWALLGAGLLVAASSWAVEAPGDGDEPAAPEAKPPARPFVKLFVGVSGLELDVGAKDGVQTTYTPNPAAAVGVSVDYAGFGGAFSTNVSEPLNDAETHGRTEYTDIQLHYHGRRVLIDAYFQRYKGFASGCEEEEKAVCTLHPDLTVSHYGLSGYYVFNPDWSAKAAYEQSERQAGDAGTWLVGAAVSRVGVNHDGRYVVATVGGGYGQTWVWESGWYLAPAILAGLGAAYGDEPAVAGGDRRRQAWLSAIRATARLGVGYHTGAWVFSINSFVDGPVVESGDVVMAWRAMHGEIAVGHRF